MMCDLVLREGCNLAIGTDFDQCRLRVDTESLVRPDDLMRIRSRSHPYLDPEARMRIAYSAHAVSFLSSRGRWRSDATTRGQGG
jgi:hypothetical protein